MCINGLLLSHRGAVAWGLATRKKRQGQHHLSGFIRYDHHQGQIVVAALLSQLLDFVLGTRNSRRNIQQVPAVRIIILDPVPSACREEISLHL